MRTTTRPSPTALAAGVATLLVAALSACAPADEDAATTPGVSGSVTPTDQPADCSPTSLDTLEPGTLTIATDQPAYEPWMVGDDPTNGQGFESAVAYAVAE